jgi:hypothetical protein
MEKSTLRGAFFVVLSFIDRDAAACHRLWNAENCHAIGIFFARTRF